MKEKSFTLLEPKSKNLKLKKNDIKFCLSSQSTASSVSMQYAVCTSTPQKIPCFRTDDEELGWCVFRCVGIFTRAGKKNQNNGV